MNLEIFNDLIVVKRSGQRVNFNGPKIAIAIKHAFDSIHDIYNEQNVNQVYQAVLEYIKINYKDRKTINVEDIQDIIENVLQQKKYTNVYLSFNNYRLKRAASREAFNVKQQHKFVKAIEKIGLKVKSDSNQTPMEKILDFGKIISNEFSKAYLLESKYIRAHEEGSIFIHDINYYTLGITSASVLDFSNYDLNDNNEMIDEIIETIKNIKKEQYGEHIIPNLDLILQKSVLNNFKNLYKTKLINYLTIKGFVEYINVNFLEKCIDKLGEINFDKNILNSFIKSTEVQELFNKAYDDAYEDLKKGLNKNIYKMLTKLNQLDNMINNNQTIIMLGNNTSIE
ncbi:MAG: hypothetical protein GX861_00670, partial [Tenericutes bacterium]|nr:hypothetical protein [Mycoplasmatota bacterium]